MIVAILGGAAVGVERQRSGHATGPDARLGGVRTFTLLGIVAGMAGWLTRHDFALPAGLIIAGAVALTVAGYVRASTRDIDGTTEVAALVVMGAGVLGGLGELRLSAALTTLTVLLLVEKPRLHRLVDRIDETTLLAAARVAVMSVVVLPLLPEGSFGPAPGVRPRGLWILVMMFSGMSFAGYVAQRLAGAAGYPITGLLGGLVSSTSVTLTFARLSRSQAGQASPLATRLPSSMRRCSRRWASTSQRRLLRGCWHSPWRGARCADRARDGGRIPGRVVRGSLLAHADGRGRRDVRPGVTLTFRARPLQPIVSNAPMTFGRSAATGEVMKMSSEA